MSRGIRPWEIVSTGPAEDFHIFQVRRQVAISPRTGAEHDRVVLTAPDWVNVVALTPTNEVVLIDQYRHGTAEVMVEIPGGMIDPGESPLEAATRELLEETGYAGNSARLIGKVHPNPAFLNNACYTVLVEDAERVSEQQMDGGEDIAVRLVPLGEISGQIASGEITHALVVVAFHWLALAGLSV